VREPPQAAFLLALLALVLGVGAVFARVPLPVAGAVLAGVLPLVAAASFALLVWGRIAVPATTSLLAAPLAYVAIASYRYMFLERRAQESERELHVARTIQERLLPAAPPVVDGLDVYGINVPAREVGGDYFDFLVLGPGRLLVALGDVSGKGVPAALLMSHLQASLHAESRDGRTPRAILQAMDELLYRSTASGRYATFFLAIVDVHAGTVRYCNAGHNAGLLVRGAELVRLESGSAALGLLPGTQFEDAGQPFAPGDVLVLYSDGITEAVGRRDEMFGDERLDARVLELAPRAGTAAEVGGAILDDVRRFTRGQPASDDITLVVVRRP
jgi:sigma-B regulation protein RsbU (phosphoserine phosphatase)